MKQPSPQCEHCGETLDYWYLCPSLCPPRHADLGDRIEYEESRRAVKVVASRRFVS